MLTRSAARCKEDVFRIPRVATDWRPREFRVAKGEVKPKDRFAPAAQFAVAGQTCGQPHELAGVQRQLLRGYERSPDQRITAFSRHSAVSEVLPSLDDGGQRRQRTPLVYGAAGDQGAGTFSGSRDRHADGQRSPGLDERA